MLGYADKLAAKNLDKNRESLEQLKGFSIDMAQFFCVEGHEHGCDERIKEKEEEMVALIAKNARVGSYTDEFDERYRRIAEEITTLKEEQIEARRKKKLADSYEQRLKDMDSFLEKQTCQIPEFDNDLVRRLIASIKVVSAEKLIIQVQSGIVMEGNQI